MAAELRGRGEPPSNAVRRVELLHGPVQAEGTEGVQQGDGGPARAAHANRPIPV